MPCAMKLIRTYLCKRIELRPPLAQSFTWTLLFLWATTIKTSPLTFWKWLSVPNHVGHDNVGHFHRGEWGVLGFFNKPLICFVMHWLYFTVKPILFLRQPVHFSLNCLFSNCHSLCFPLCCADIIYLFYETTTTPSKQNNLTPYLTTDRHSVGCTDRQTDKWLDGCLMDGHNYYWTW